jgi:hypothetical protein
MVRHASLRAFAIPSVRRGPAHLRSGRQGSADGPASNVAKGGGGTWSAPDSTMCSGEAPSIETPTRQHMDRAVPLKCRRSARTSTLATTLCISRKWTTSV